MSTRGLYGFRKDGKDKLTYNHCDSYPEILGHKILNFCKDVPVETLKDFYDSIELVDEDTIPTPEQIKKCKECGYADFSVGSRSDTSWYCLLRNLQGNFKILEEAIEKNHSIYMTDGNYFIKDSLFCEYAYIINLDSESLEFWIGFQTEPCEGNRYGEEPYQEYLAHGKEYYPCKFALNIPLNAIDNVNKWVKKMKETEKNDE